MASRASRTAPVAETIGLQTAARAAVAACALRLGDPVADLAGQPVDAAQQHAVEYDARGQPRAHGHIGQVARRRRVVKAVDAERRHVEVFVEKGGNAKALGQPRREGKILPVQIHCQPHNAGLWVVLPRRAQSDGGELRSRGPGCSQGLVDGADDAGKGGLAVAGVGGRRVGAQRLQAGVDQQRFDGRAADIDADGQRLCGLQMRHGLARLLDLAARNGGDSVAAGGEKCQPRRRQTGQ
jgi:hypothetical protein